MHLNGRNKIVHSGSIGRPTAAAWSQGFLAYFHSTTIRYGSSVSSLIKSISLKDMASIKVPLLPLTVQKQIVAEFNQYEEMIAVQNEAANSIHTKCRERLKALWGID